MPPTKTGSTVKQKTIQNEVREQASEVRKTAAKRRAVPKRRPVSSAKATSSKTAGARNAVSKQASSKASYTIAGVKRASILLKQVSDATRLQILLLLSDAEHNVGAICNELGGQSQPAVSHHLAKLRDGRLIEPRREGKNNVYMLTEEGRLLAHTVKSLTWLKA